MCRLLRGGSLYCYSWLQLSGKIPSQSLKKHKPLNRCAMIWSSFPLLILSPIILSVEANKHRTSQKAGYRCYILPRQNLLNQRNLHFPENKFLHMLWRTDRQTARLVTTYPWKCSSHSCHTVASFFRMSLKNCIAKTEILEETSRLQCVAAAAFRWNQTKSSNILQHASQFSPWRPTLRHM